jgi:hypothetical protein
MALTATSFLGIWMWLARAEELCHPDLKPLMKIALRRALIGPVAYLSGALIALASAPAAFGVCAFVGPPTQRALP